MLQQHWLRTAAQSLGLRPLTRLCKPWRPLTHRVPNFVLSSAATPGPSGSDPGVSAASVGIALSTFCNVSAEPKSRLCVARFRSSYHSLSTSRTAGCSWAAGTASRAAPPAAPCESRVPSAWRVVDGDHHASEVLSRVGPYCVAHGPREGSVHPVGSTLRFFRLCAARLGINLGMNRLLLFSFGSCRRARRCRSGLPRREQ